MKNEDMKISKFVANRNSEKKLFTAGPASLLEENIYGLMPCFGRGDISYSEVESRVLDSLKAMSGHSKIVRLQGSASLALEIMTLNFLYGNVLIVNTGYYSERMNLLSKYAERLGNIESIKIIDWKDLSNISGNFDWIVACPTETSCGLRIPIEELKQVAVKVKSRLMLDATASIGLEEGHELADVIAYSSCKGLFGLTGAAFIAFNELPSIKVESFYLDIVSHLEKRMTGPYHAIASLDYVLKDHAGFREAVVINKERFMMDMKEYLTFGKEHQPLLCTKVSCEISTKDTSSILYKPRTDDPGSVVCHLGEVHLAREAKGKILKVLEPNR